MHRVTETESVSGKTVSFRMDITSVNRPVHVTLPTAGQTLVPPASFFGGAASSSSS